MNQDKLRIEVKNQKKNNSIQYTYFSSKLNMNKNSFYNFMNNKSNLSEDKEEKLESILRRLKSYGL